MINQLNKILFKLFGLRLISSQCGEDFIIESIIPSKKRGLYVDIGANHPIKYSNTFLFRQKGWRGINIEPNPHRIKSFRFWRRGDVNLNIGVADKEAELDFFVFKEHTLSTFDVESANEFQKIGHRVKEVIKVPVLPLCKIFEKYLNGRQVDLLSIDTEGYDMEILQSNDWTRFQPTFIIVETLEYRKEGEGKKLNVSFDPFFASIGYKKIADTNINTIYEKIS